MPGPIVELDHNSKCNQRSYHHNRTKQQDCYKYFITYFFHHLSNFDC